MVNNSTRIRTLEHASTWWRSGITLKQGQLIPTGSFIEYDPFQFYFPKGKANRGYEKSLPYCFLDVVPEDETAIISFCEKYGVLGDIDMDFTRWSIATFPFVKVEGKEISLTEWSLSNKMPQEIHEKYERAIAGIFRGKRPDSSLCTPLSIDGFRNAQNRLRAAIKYIKLADPQKETQEFFFGKPLSSVRPTLRWNEQAAKWITGWDIASLEAVMYLMLLFDAQGRGYILTCPWCSGTFLGDRQGTTYCSSKCYECSKTTRARHRKKQKVKKTKGGSHGKTKRKG